MAPEIDLNKQRKADYVFENHVTDFIGRLEQADRAAGGDFSASDAEKDGSGEDSRAA